MGKDVRITSEEEMMSLASKIAGLVDEGSVILLNGDLGVGKTVFARGFIKFLTEEKQTVVSPTFTLVQVYNTKSFDIWHFDLYRLQNESDLYELGIEDALSSGVCLIEWPDLVKPFLNNNKVINIDINIIDKDLREVKISDISKEFN